MAEIEKKKKTKIILTSSKHFSAENIPGMNDSFSEQWWKQNF